MRLYIRTGHHRYYGHPGYVNAFADPCRALGYRLPCRRKSARGNPMGDKNKSQKIGDSIKEMSHYAEQQRLGHGRIEFDELGNAIWVPASGASSDEVMRRLLDDPTLALGNDYSKGSDERIQPNQYGVKKGYDPYDSGLLVKKEW